MKHILPIAVIVVLLVVAFQKHEPKPDPSGPIIGKGMRVLIVEETAERSKLPPAQSAILTSGTIQDYLNEHCSKEKSDKSAWRIFDKDTDMSQEAKFWQDAMLRPHPKLPWVIISKSPGRGFEGPLPTDTAAFLELLQKYE